MIQRRFVIGLKERMFKNKKFFCVCDRNGLHMKNNQSELFYVFIQLLKRYKYMQQRFFSLQFPS